MKAVIGGVSFTAPTTQGGSDGTLVISGLTGNTGYSATYIKDAVSGSATGTTDVNGNLSIFGLLAGSFSGITVTQDGDGNEASDPWTETVVIPDGEAPGSDVSPSQGIINNYLSTSSAHEDPREAVMQGSVALIEGLRGLKALASSSPVQAGKDLLDIFIADTISNVETTTTTFLTNLTNQENG